MCLNMHVESYKVNKNVRKQNHFRISALCTSDLKFIIKSNKATYILIWCYIYGKIGLPKLYRLYLTIHIR